MGRIGILLAALLVLAGLVKWTSPARATLLADQPYRFDANGRLLTDVYVDGQGPFSFLIDTASSRSLIFEHVRARLHLAQSDPQLLTIYGINDIATAMPVRPGQLRVAGEAISGLTMGVLPDPANPADEPDGVLGIDALARYFVVIDRAAMRFKLLTPGGDVGAFLNWAGISLTPHPLKKIPLDFWYLRARYDGIAVNTLFDLGASVTMLNWPAAELLGLHKNDYRQYNPPPEELRDVLGTDAPAVRILDLNITMPGMSWTKQLALVSAAPVFSWFNLDERPAVIVGPGLLRDNSLAIDFAGHRLFVGPVVGRNHR